MFLSSVQGTVTASMRFLWSQKFSIYLKTEYRQICHIRTLKISAHGVLALWPYAARTRSRSQASFLWRTQPLGNMSTSVHIPCSSPHSGSVSHFGSQTNYLQSFCSGLWLHNQNKGAIQFKWQDTFNHSVKHQRERLCACGLLFFCFLYVFIDKTQCTLFQVACLYQRKTFDFKKGEKKKTELDIHSLHTSAR